MKRVLIVVTLLAPLLARAAGKQPLPMPPPPPAAPPPAAAAPLRTMTFVLGLSAGALVPLNKLGASVAGTAEAGLLAHWTGQELGLAVALTYNQPAAAGAVSDPRVPGGAYDWSLQQRSLVVTPALLYRLTSLGGVVPYLSVGPRLSFLEQNGSGAAATEGLGTTTETVLRLGAAGRLGAELLLGPGGFTLEALFEWAPLGSKSAGAGSTLMGVTGQLGYRLVL